jgi:hypothetical protein
MSDLTFKFDTDLLEGLSGSDLLSEKLSQVVDREDLDVNEKIHAVLMVVADRVGILCASDRPKFAKWARDVLEIVLEVAMQGPITETHLH